MRNESGSSRTFGKQKSVSQLARRDLCTNRPVESGVHAFLPTKLAVREASPSPVDTATNTTDKSPRASSVTLGRSLWQTVQFGGRGGPMISGDQFQLIPSTDHAWVKSEAECSSA